ncbi:MAG: trypsin-like peptidase domain-containing protein [Rectinemataceae bacterium]
MAANGLLGAFALFLFTGASSASPAWAQNDGSPSAQPVTDAREFFANTIADVAANAEQSVVHIDTTGTMLQQLPVNGPFGIHAPRDTSAVVPVSGLGSGILLDRDGHILTNNHVVENADTISVRFFDGSVKPAKLVGADPYTDLAVVQVDGPIKVAPARLGDSASMRVGDWVVAIGSPEGLDWTVTAGIISAKHRSDIGIGEPTGTEDYIQTDAPINRGNSGGPLLNLDGEVIGINTVIVSESNGSEGLGFAIPVSIVRTIAESLIRLGKVVRGDLGMRFQDLTPAIGEALKLPSDTVGAAVVEVIPEGPAEASGLKQGDVIVRYAGSPVRSSIYLKRAVAASNPGDSVSLDIIRDGKPAQLSARVGDQYALSKQVAARPGYKMLGLAVRAMGGEEAKSLGLPSSSGVIVTQVVPGSPADQANINVGDIIFMVGNADVANPTQFTARIADAAKSDSVLLLIHDASTGMIGYLEVPLKR